MQNYATLIEAIDGLRDEGYTEDFNLQQDCLVFDDEHKVIYKVTSDEFVVDKYYRFEDDTDPSNQSIIYAISSQKYLVKGILINGYGIYAEPATNDMIEKLNILPR